MFLKSKNIPPKLNLAVKVILLLVYVMIVNAILQINEISHVSSYTAGVITGIIFNLCLNLVFGYELYKVRKLWVCNVYIIYSLFGALGAVLRVNSLIYDLNALVSLVGMFAIILAIVIGTLNLFIIYLLSSKEVRLFFKLRKIN